MQATERGCEGEKKKKEKKETLGEGGKDGSLETSIHPGGKNIRFPEKEEKKKKKKKEDEKTLPHDRPT